MRLIQLIHVYGGKRSQAPNQQRIYITLAESVLWMPILGLHPVFVQMQVRHGDWCLMRCNGKCCEHKIWSRAGLEEVKCEITVESSFENIFFSASSECSHWIREQAAVQRCDADGIFDKCHVKLTQILEKLVMRVTQRMSQLAHHLFWESSNNAGLTTMADVSYISASLHHYMLLLCCFLRNPTTTVSPQTVLSQQVSYQVIAPLFFSFALSLMRKTLYKHPAYLCLYCSLVSYLLSGLSPHGISQYTGS